MSTNAWVVSVTACFAAAAILAGCSGSSDGPVNGAPQDSEMRGTINRAITLSFSGDVEGASSLLLGNDDPQPSSISPLPCLELNETEYRRLSGSVLADMEAQNLKASNAIRQLARAIIAKSEEARRDSEKQKADFMLARVRSMGQTLDTKEYTDILRMLGRALVKKVDATE